jgi:hypothetical protein
MADARMVYPRRSVITLRTGLSRDQSTDELATVVRGFGIQAIRIAAPHEGCACHEKEDARDCPSEVGLKN